jgi:hypothetical protein
MIQVAGFQASASDVQDVVRKRAALCVEVANATWVDIFTHRYNESAFRALVTVLGLTALEEGWIRLQCETVIAQ